MTEPTTVIHSRDSAKYGKGQVVYIGRPSRWGNPFVIGKHGSRSEVILLYKNRLIHELQETPGLVPTLRSLRGKALGCYCAPKPCHGDVLAELADMDDAELTETIDEWMLENRR